MQPTIKDQIREWEPTSSDSNIGPIVSEKRQTTPQNISVLDTNTSEENQIIKNKLSKIDLTGSSSNIGSIVQQPSQTISQSIMTLDTSNEITMEDFKNLLIDD